MDLNLRNIIVFFLAVGPALVWLYLFLRQHRENKWMTALTFFGGMLAAKLILVYQAWWGSSVNLVFFQITPTDFRLNIEALILNTLLATFLIFLGVGAMEEFTKFWIMRFLNHRFFRSIDDVIQLAIVSALGFAFFENIQYFLQQWGKLSLGAFFGFALFRVTIVTMVHVLCSGVLGYYYGMAFFASPMLKIQEMKERRHPILTALKKILPISRSEVYHDEMLMFGLFMSMFLHAMYDFVLSIQWSVAGIPLYIPVMLLYFFGGFWYLNSLFRKKDLNLKLGLVGTTVMPKEDFVKLLSEVQVIKARMQDAIMHA